MSGSCSQTIGKNRACLSLSLIIIPSISFSILFNKELFVFGNRRSGKSADISLRYKEQLTAYGMGHRLITEEDDVTGNHLQPIDYKKVNEIFSQKLKNWKKTDL